MTQIKFQDPLLNKEDYRAYREGNWYFLTHKGKIVYKRHTRDGTFDVARVIFYSNISPPPPLTQSRLKEYDLSGPWNKGRFYPSKHIYVIPIERNQND